MADPNHASKLPTLPLRSPGASYDLPSSPPVRNSMTSSGNLGHRSSFAENIRSLPPSPRSQRHPSFTQAAVQELLNHPPAMKPANARFAGRDWRQIRVGELVSLGDVRFVESNVGVEKATKLLIESGAPNVVLVRGSPNELSAYDTFDYNDLNAYLLVVLGLANPNEDQIELFTDIAKKAREGVHISLAETLSLAKKAPLVTLSESQDLSKAIEIFAGGVHRILIVQQGTGQVIGILSQFTLVKFLWDNGASFPIIDQLYPMILRDLNVGTHQTIAIKAEKTLHELMTNETSGDRPLTDALRLMSDEGLTSVAIVDNSLNVVGNISTADVKHLTNTSSLPFLKSSCLNFTSVILSERGVENGKDSFPVFHVNPYSTLAHTTAKLVATKSHRMWVVEGSSPSPSAPATPAVTPAVLVPPPGASPASSPSLTPSFPVVVTGATNSGISGRLTGVVSLTDILNLFARQSGLNPSDPNDQRQRRRRSSSSSLRPSMEFVTGSRSSVDLRR